MKYFMGLFFLLRLLKKNHTKENAMKELEEKIINVIKLNRDIVKGLVVGCDLDIGITIVAEHDHDRYLFCCHGPLSPLRKDGRLDEEVPEKYNFLFGFVVAKIKKGVFIYKEIMDFATVHGGNGFWGEGAVRELCPFGQ